VIPLLLLLPFFLLALAFQRHLLFPAPKRNAVLSGRHHAIMPIVLATGAGKLHGYYARPHAEPASPPRGLIYFNGRREHPTSIFRSLAQLPGHHVFCFRYPGLGFALRKPCEAQMIEISLAAFDAFSAHASIQPEHMTVAGRSLGSGLAVNVAARRKPASVILISPFDRLANVLSRRFPLIAVRFLKDKYDTAAVVSEVVCPCLLIVGEVDDTIPSTISRRLFAGWQGELSVVALAASGHRGILKRQDVHELLGSFVARG
jgi:uncharacterized protein